jgi:hypothetical protein
MKRTDQARVLAEFLVPLLPNLCDASRPLAVLGADHEEVVDPTEPDVHLAVRLELQHIVSSEPDLLTLAADASEPVRDRAAERLASCSSTVTTTPRRCSGRCLPDLAPSPASMC